MNCYACDKCAIQDASNNEILYEIHITVKDADVSLFKETCKEINVKPILLDLHKEGVFDLMTSSVIKGIDYIAAKNQAITTSAQLLARGFKVIRSKIETVPWNPLIETFKKGYGESHLAVYTDDINRLKLYCKPFDAHVSSNMFKTDVVMVTIREYSNNINDLIKKTNVLEFELREKGFGIHKKITEYCVYDSNLKHDNLWIKD